MQAIIDNFAKFVEENALIVCTIMVSNTSTRIQQRKTYG